jgi:hypothetical protein
VAEGICLEGSTGEGGCDRFAGFEELSRQRKSQKPVYLDTLKDLFPNWGKRVLIDQNPKIFYLF